MRKTLTSLFLSTGLLLATGSTFAQTPVVVYKPEVAPMPVATTQIGLDAASKLFAALNYQSHWLNDSRDTLIVQCSRNGVAAPIYVTLSADGRDICLRSYLTKLDGALAARAPWEKMVDVQESINPIQFSYVPSTGWLSMWYSIDNHNLTKELLESQITFYVDNLFATRNLWDPNQWVGVPLPAPAPPAPMAPMPPKPAPAPTYAPPAPPAPAPAPQANNSPSARESARLLHDAIVSHTNRCKSAMSVLSVEIDDYVEGKTIDIDKLRRDQAEYAKAETALLDDVNRMTASDDACRRMLAAYQDYCRWMLPRISAVLADCTQRIVAAADLAQPGATREAATKAINAELSAALSELTERNKTLAAAAKEFSNSYEAVASN